MSYKFDLPLTDSILEDIISKHFPDRNLTSFEEITNSFVNSVYSFVLDEESTFILKFNNPRWPLKQQREIEAMMKVKLETSLPVPTIVAISDDDSKYQYMIQTKAKGVEFRSALATNDLSTEEILTLIEQIGAYLGELHSISYDFFGDASSVYSKVNSTQNYLWGNRFDNWNKCFRAFCLDILHWVDKESFAKFRPKLRQKIDELTSIIPSAESACFVHSDIQPSNIIIDGNQISAIIDFEWSFAGSASFDYYMTKAGFYFSEFPSITESNLYSDYSSLSVELIDNHFLKGYKTKSNQKLAVYPADFLDFIWLLYMIGSWSWTVQTSSKEEQLSFEKNIHSLAKKFIL